MHEQPLALVDGNKKSPLPWLARGNVMQSRGTMKVSAFTLLVLVAHVKSMYLGESDLDGGSSVVKNSCFNPLQVESLKNVQKFLSAENYNPAGIGYSEVGFIMQTKEYSIASQILAEPGVSDLLKSEALPYACFFHNVPMVKHLLADPTFDNYTNANRSIKYLSGVPLDYAESTRIEIAKLLLSDPRAHHSTNLDVAFLNACTKPRLELVKLLLASPNVDPSVNDNEALRMASKHGHYYVAKLLLADPRVDPSANNNEAIENACSSGNELLVKLLLCDPRVDPSAVTDTALNSKKASTSKIPMLVQFAKNYSNLDLETTINIESYYGYSRDHLDIVISRNSANPKVRAYIFRKQLELINLPDKLREAPLFQNFVNNIAMMSSVLTCDELESAIQAFMPFYEKSCTITGVPEIDAKIFFQMLFTIKEQSKFL